MLDARDSSAPFYGAGDDELHLAFNFMFLHADVRRRDAARRSVETHRGSCCPRDAWPVWTGGNHDITRFPTRWADGDDRGARAPR